MNIMLDEGAKLPTKAHREDAGWDLYSRETATIYPGESHTFDTGVHMELLPGTAGVLISKSGLNVNHGLTSTGLIDESYTGSIRVKLYNHSHEAYTVRKGDKVSQIVIISLAPVHELTVVSRLSDSDRGDNGFGSSGR